MRTDGDGKASGEFVFSMRDAKKLEQYVADTAVSISFVTSAGYGVPGSRIQGFSHSADDFGLSWPRR